MIVNIYIYECKCLTICLGKTDVNICTSIYLYMSVYLDDPPPRPSDRGGHAPVSFIVQTKRCGCLHGVYVPQQRPTLRFLLNRHLIGLGVKAREPLSSRIAGHFFQQNYSKPNNVPFPYSYIIYSRPPLVMEAANSPVSTGGVSLKRRNLKAVVLTPPPPPFFSSPGPTSYAFSVFFLIVFYKTLRVRVRFRSKTIAT